MSELAISAAQAHPDSFAGRLGRGARWVEQRLWLALPILAIPALLPFVQIGLPESADGIAHLLRVVVLDQHIRNGALYPRWAPDLYMGLGYPVFNFYGPLVYYLAELLHLVGLDFVSALMAAFAVLVLASGFGMYRLALDVLGEQQRWAALVAATAYMYAPQLLTNVYVRGALAEVGAQAWLPWVLWSTRRLLTGRQPQQYVMALAFSLAGLAMTHNITLLFTPLVLAGYVGVLWWHGGRDRRRLGWVAVGLAAAMGVSAFFWLPLVGERQFLAGYGYEIAARFLSLNVWTWSGILDTGFFYQHSLGVPKLGLVQIALALVGLIAVRRRDPEWLYFIVLAVLAGLGISAWALPLWESSELLLIPQFPWRLLIFVTLPLALFAGAILAPVGRRVIRLTAAAGLLALIIFANRPQVGWMSTLASTGEIITPSVVTQAEFETGAFGTMSAEEFRPRWSTGNAYEPSSDDLAPDDRRVLVSQASAYRLQTSVVSSSAGPLRFTSFYYPGWRATLEDGEALPTYPSTNLGLLTVDLPPGSHEVTVSWVGTDLHRLAAWISLVTLALLAVFAWRTSRPRWLAAAPLTLLLFGASAMLIEPPVIDVQTPPVLVTAGNLDLTGYWLERASEGELDIYPYWYVRQTPPGDTLVRWQLRDQTGQIVSATTARPYFNSQQASDWPPGTLVDDAYRLSLPPGLPAGSYDLGVQILQDGSATDWATVGAVTLDTPAPAVAAQPPAAALPTVRFGGLVEFTGYDLTHDGQAVDAASPRPLVLRPGDTLDYTLYWQPLQPLLKNYHGFIHLIDSNGQPLAKRDKVAGSFLRTPMSWDARIAQPDHYSLQIPRNAPSGLYWPTVGLYEFRTVELLPVADSGGQSLGDVYRLPPVKVLGANATAPPQTLVSARLGDLATLLGYDLALPEAGLRPGSQFDLTLYYQVNAATDQDLTQFVQLYHPDLGMAAQRDARPLDGGNPTWAWVPGEIVAHTTTLQIRPDAAAGEYHLFVGLYDPGDGTRLAVQDAQGTDVPDRQVDLTPLVINP